ACGACFYYENGRAASPFWIRSKHASGPSAEAKPKPGKPTKRKHPKRNTDDSWRKQGPPNKPEHGPDARFPSRPSQKEAAVKKTGKKELALGIGRKRE